MKRLLLIVGLFATTCSIAVARHVDSQAQRQINRVKHHEDKTKIVFKGDTIAIYATDLDCAQYALAGNQQKHPEKVFKVYVAVLSSSNPQVLLRGEADVPRLSFDTTVDTGYHLVCGNIMADIAVLTANHSENQQGKLELIENLLGLDKINAPDLSVDERCYRVCWVYGILFNPDIKPKSIQIIFITRSD